ncbi:hypothetical protein [Zhihengliuella flava]|uniref:Uncharacterized protein n=1 Tax=Zhihengliuella flava TaxID=1285193 RepID=A0A931DAA5_9MICC|nr:hypothetical protein [Zhihengliuella flava]MBG6085342.1 hypothetical protein [Zhihengliuella flava]
MGTHAQEPEHETSLERAMDMAEGNAKEAKRLLDKARAYYEAGEIDRERLTQLERLYDVALQDQQRAAHDV